MGKSQGSAGGPYGGNAGYDPCVVSKAGGADFLTTHLNVLAGCDFFTVEVLTWRGLATYYVLFFIQLESRRVTITGITRHPDEEWMTQMALNATLEGWGSLGQCRHVLHDRDAKFFATYREAL